MTRLIFLSFLIFISYSALSYSQPIDVYVGAPGTGPGGSDPRFSTVREACDYLQAQIWTDKRQDYTFYVTSDISEPAGVVLEINNPVEMTSVITFTAMPGTSPVITFTPSGDTAETEYGWFLNERDCFIILSSLTIQSDSSSDKNIIPLKVDGGNSFNSYTVIYECNILYKSHTENAGDGSMFCAVYVDAITTEIRNSFISSDFPGVSPYSSGIIVEAVDRGGIDSNDIEAKKNGILVLSVGRDLDIMGNEITLNQDKIKTEITGINGGTNILGNKIILSKNNYSMASSQTGIMAWVDRRVVNNMISGFYMCNNHLDSLSELTGIYAAPGEEPVAFNTILMNDLLIDSCSNNPLYIGIKLPAFSAINVMNNIVVNMEEDIPAYSLYFNGNFLVSDYNNFYSPGSSAYTGYYKGTAAKTLSDWQALTGQDSNSVSVQVYFVSASDLHLTGASIGDNNLSGISVSLYDTDIDGDNRDDVYPYMGADEASVPLTARVISSVEDNFMPERFELQQNYPNPFNPVTKIDYNLPNEAHVKLEVISITGEVVKVLVDESKSAGSYTSYFTANNFASGTYIYRLTAGDNVVSRKMILLK